MEDVFIKVLNMSINASWLILVVLIFRLLFNKAPKRIRLILWGVVAFRLISPFSFKSIFSLIPSSVVVPQGIAMAETPYINSGIGAVNDIVNPFLAENFSANIGDSVNPMQIVLLILAVIWIVGVLSMLIYTMVSVWIIHRKIRESIIYKENIYFCEKISTPFIFGLIKPKIYLPVHIDDEDKSCVIAHEKQHIKNRDYLWKPLGFLVLSIHWFNPIVWLSYGLFCKDMELSCDESVIAHIGKENKKAYANALINCSAQRNTITVCPVAFGEVSIKSRIKTVMKYKKPAFWLVLLALLTTFFAVVCFAGNPIYDGENKSFSEKAHKIDSMVAQAVISHNTSFYDTQSDELLLNCESHEIIHCFKDAEKNSLTVYAMIFCGTYKKSSDNSITKVSNAFLPVKIIFKIVSDGNYEIKNYIQPNSSKEYSEDMKEYIFNNDSFNESNVKSKLSAECYNKAKNYFN